MKPPLTANESQNLQGSGGFPDASGGTPLDDFAALAAMTFEMPVALISLADGSCHLGGSGSDIGEMARGVAEFTRKAHPKYILRENRITV